MNRLIILISMIVLTVSAGFISLLHSKPQVKGYYFNYSVPLPKKDGGFLLADTRYDVYYYRDLLMFKVYYTYDSSLNNRSLLREERTYNLVFHKDSIYGQVFYQIPRFDKTRERIVVDSIVRRVRYESDVYDTFSRMKPDSSYMEGDDLVKVYQIEPTAAFPEKYTYSFYYSPTINPPTEYFSRSMENVKNMRLFKIKMLAHGGQWPNESYRYPERELKLEMSLASNAGKEEAMKYFNKYLGKNK